MSFFYFLVLLTYFLNQLVFNKKINYLNMLNFKVKYYLKKIEILHFVYYFYKNKTYNKFKNLDCSIIESYKWFNLKDENYAFLPTFPSSGMNYLINIINYYLNKKIYKKKFFFLMKMNIIKIENLNIILLVSQI